MRDVEEERLPAMGRELLQHLQRRIDPPTDAALAQERQLALQRVATSAHRRFSGIRRTSAAAFKWSSGR